MSSVSLHQFLTLYSWFPLAALLLFLLLIARLYARFSNQRTYYWLYLVPMIGSGMVVVRSSNPHIPVEDLIVVFTSAVSGVLLMGLVLRLGRLMLAHKPV